MNGFHEDYKEQLLASAASLFSAAPAARANPARGARRPTLIAAVALGALILAAAAFAAGRLIGVGAPRE